MRSQEQDIFDDLDDFIEEEVMELALDIYSQAIKMSPVDTGTFKGSWRVSPNQIDSSTGRNVESPQSVRTRISGSYKIGQDLWVSNSVEYANALENGHSKKAPNGILKNAIFIAIKKRQK